MSPVYLTDVISITCLLCKCNPFIKIRKKIIADSTSPTSGNALDVKTLIPLFFNHIAACPFVLHMPKGFLQRTQNDLET